MELAQLADEMTARYVIPKQGERAQVHKWKVYLEPIQTARQV